MPIEIKELPIKVTVPPLRGEGAADDVADLFLFDATWRDGWGGRDAAWRDDVAADDLPPDPVPVEAGGVNTALGDGSVRAVSDGFDLFG